MSRGFVLSSSVTSSGTVLVHVRGDLQVGIAADVRAVMGPYVRAGRRRVCIDASEARYVDEAALDALVEVARELRRAGGDLTVRCVSREKLFRSSYAATTAQELSATGSRRPSSSIATVEA